MISSRIAHTGRLAGLILTAFLWLAGCDTGDPTLTSECEKGYSPQFRRGISAGGYVCRATTDPDTIITIRFSGQVLDGEGSPVIGAVITFYCHGLGEGQSANPDLYFPRFQPVFCSGEPIRTTGTQADYENASHIVFDRWVLERRNPKARPILDSLTVRVGASHSLYETTPIIIFGLPIQNYFRECEDCVEVIEIDSLNFTLQRKV